MVLPDGSSNHTAGHEYLTTAYFIFTDPIFMAGIYWTSRPRLTCQFGTLKSFGPDSSTGPVTHLTGWGLACWRWRAASFRSCATSNVRVMCTGVVVQEAIAGGPGFFRLIANTTAAPSTSGLCRPTVQVLGVRRPHEIYDAPCWHRQAESFREITTVATSTLHSSAYRELRSLSA